MNSEQIQNLKKAGVSSKGIKYIQDVIDLSKHENPWWVYSKLVFVMFIAIVMFIACLIGSPDYNLVAILTPLVLFRENFTEFFSNNIWKKDHMKVSEKNIRRFLSVDLQILKPGAFRRFGIVLSFAVIFAGLLVLGSVAEISTFVVLTLLMAINSFINYDKYRKSLVESINHYAENVSCAKEVQVWLVSVKQKNRDKIPIFYFLFWFAVITCSS